MSLVLVTGGAGFIGSHLAMELLRAGHTVRILDNLSPQIHGGVPTGTDWLRHEGIEFIRGSVTAKDDMCKALAGVDVVVHLAAETGTGQSMYEIARYTEVNVGGTAVLLDVLANDSSRSVRRIVLASSRSIYGEGAYICHHCSPVQRQWPSARSQLQLLAHSWEYSCPACGHHLEPVPTREDDPARPASIYAATKFAQEDLIRVGCTALGVDYAILRLQNVYGEGQSLGNPYTGILSIFSSRIRRNQQLPIFEDGLETRDFVHVQDVAQIMRTAVEHPQRLDTVLNVGTGLKTTVIEMASLLSRAFGVSPNYAVTRQYRLGDIRHNCADIMKLRAVLGVVSMTPLSVGLERFASWVLTQQLPHAELENANAELIKRNLMG